MEYLWFYKIKIWLIYFWIDYFVLIIKMLIVIVGVLLNVNLRLRICFVIFFYKEIKYSGYLIWFIGVLFLGLRIMIVIFKYFWKKIWRV